MEIKTREMIREHSSIYILLSVVVVLGVFNKEDISLNIKSAYGSTTKLLLNHAKHDVSSRFDAGKDHV